MRRTNGTSRRLARPGTTSCWWISTGTRQIVLRTFDASGAATSSEFIVDSPGSGDAGGAGKKNNPLEKYLWDTMFDYGVDVFVTSIQGDSALLYPLQIWDDIEQQLDRLPRTHSAKRRFLERVSYYGQQGTLDSQGRIVIPPLLRTSARMVGEVVVLGMQDHLQVWNRELCESMPIGGLKVMPIHPGQLFDVEQIP